MSDILQLPCLGRHFSLGTLYDYRKDNVIPGVTLWNSETLKKARRTENRIKNSFDVIASDNLEAKTMNLGISGDLKLSVLSGLVEVKGSASYLYNQKTSTTQARVSLKFSSTSDFEELTMEQIAKIEHEEVFDKDIATHVVTGVEYGANGILVFDKELSSDEDEHKVIGKLKAMVDIIPKVEIGGSADVDFNQKHKESVVNFHCNFHGDFAIESIPTTFEEAVKLCKELPRIVSKSEPVPMTVWLYPLQKLNYSSNRILRSICASIVNDIQKLLQDLYDLQIECSDFCQHDNTVKKFPDLQEQMKEFEDLVFRHTSHVKDKISTLLPKIRCGQDVSDLTKMMISLSRNRSYPLSRQNLKSFLQRKRSEIKSIEGLLSTSNDVQFVTSDEFNVIYGEPTCHTMYCFVINVLGRADPYLEKMLEHVGTDTIPPTSDATMSGINRASLNALREQIIVFNDIVEASKSKDNVKCLIIDNIEEDFSSLEGLGAHIIMYDNRRQMFAVHVGRPSKPSATQKHIGNSWIFVKWDKPQYNAEEISKYTIKFCSTSDPLSIWRDISVEKNALKESDLLHGVTINGLTPNTAYLFQVKPVCSKQNCVGLESPVSEPIRTKESTPGQPKKPSALFVEQTSITLVWLPPDYCGSNPITHYTISYRCTSDHPEEWNHVKSLPEKLEYKLDGLIPKQKYAMKVCPESKSGQGIESESLIVETKPSLAQELAKQSTYVETLDDMITILQPPMSKSNQSMKYSIGKPNELKPEERVLMIVGATGVGKTTLLNGIANYILGVGWDDMFRFKVVANESSKSQAHSQTDTITCYSFHPIEGSKLHYTLTVIDTPGFGDTRGIMRDKELVKQIREFFSSREEGIDQLHGIGFVTRAPDARLTQTQKYVFDSILAVFGKNIASIIFVMTTFSDGQPPPVLVSLKEAEIPYRSSFKFNNSALYAKPVSNSVDKMFWDLGMVSFHTFFDKFTATEPQSLVLTKEVLEERRQLEAVVQGLQLSIQVGLNKMDEIRQEERVMKDHEADILKNKDFVYYITVTKQRMVSLAPGKHVTNCLTCNMTCHEDCGIPDDGEKYQCWAMEHQSNASKARCRICPKKCRWEVHKHNPYYFVLYQEEEERTSGDLKEKYDVAKKELSEVERMIETLKNDLEGLQEYVLEHIEQAQQSLERLNKIALKPDPLNEIEYIDLLIESEKQEKKPGFMERIEAYQVVRKQALILKDVSKSKSKKKIIRDEAWYTRLWHRWSEKKSTHENGDTVTHEATTSEIMVGAISLGECV